MAIGSHDALLASITAGKTQRVDFNKITGAAAYTAGRWYDLSGLAGSPMPTLYGELVINGSSPTTIFNWTANGTNWVVSAGVFAKTSGTSTTLTADSLNIAVVSARFYRVTYTITGYGSGTCTVSVGGTAGTARSSNATFTEVITATNTNGIVFTASVSTAAFSINNISVVEWGAASGTITPSAQILTATNNQGGLYHGGAVSTDIKNMVNASLVTAAATGVPGVLMMVDLLLAYPYIDANSASAQTCTNNNTLPRYTTGAGVRAFMVAATTVGATPHNIQMSYTNSGSTAGRAIPITTACTASAIVPHITHSGVAANNYGPFLPMATGDAGVKSIQSVTLSATSGTASTFYHMVLCKPLVTIPITTVSVAAERDLINQLPSMPQIVDGACIGFLWFAGAATAASTSFFGSFDVVWG